MAYAVIKLHCPDTKGIVYNVSRFIFDHGGNIISSLQHWEELDTRFIMRVQFDLGEVTCTREELEAHFVEVAADFGMEFEFGYSDRRRRLAIMVSRYDHCLYDLFLRYQYGELNADIALVVSNHPDLESAASFFKTPYYYIPMKDRPKEVAEQEILALFREHGVDLVVLARYMQILTPVIVGAYPNRIINVHHGFLPAFKGAKPYHQAYAKGVKIIGATSHYVTEELDMGPIIEQETIRVDHTHSIRDMQQMGRDIERRVLSRAVKAHVDDRIIVYRNRTYVFD
jgi:formyltetrahydrofolate deformylase